MGDTTEKLQKKTKDNNRANSENKNLQKQLDVSRNNEKGLQSLLDERERTLDETQAILTGYEKADMDLDNTKPSTGIHKLINDRFDQIEKSIDIIITKKLSEKTNDVQQIEAKIEEAINKSYAKTVTCSTDTKDLVNIIKSTKNDDLIQVNERERRSANFIVYGINETNNPDSSLKDHDHEFVHSFLDIIGITSRPKQIVRLGKSNDDKRRPVKVVMNNSNEKDSIMSRLSNLKNADEIYRSLSIRDDYTIEERELIREWVQKAQDKNAEENTDTWKVRGTPKNGLRLVRITKRR